MTGEGLRFNEGKLRYDLLHPHALKGLTQVLTAGANKYAERNWENGMPWSKSVLASAQRHLAKIVAGEDYDEETGLLHADHLQANAHFLSAYYKIYPEGDDRSNTYFNKRIALDIDGVLADFNSAAKSKFNISNEPYNWKYSYVYSKENFWKELSTDKDFWLNVPALFNGKDIPFEPVAYVTHRSIPKEWCEEWLEKNNFPCMPVYVVHGSKVETLKGLDIDYFVDDCYQNFTELNDNGIFTYLYDQQWNRKYNVGHRRIHSLKDLI